MDFTTLAVTFLLRKIIKITIDMNIVDVFCLPSKGM